jgi:hypothetical protein
LVDFAADVPATVAWAVTEGSPVELVSLGWGAIEVGTATGKVQACAARDMSIRQAIQRFIIQPPHSITQVGATRRSLYNWLKSGLAHSRSTNFPAYCSRVAA